MNTWIKSLMTGLVMAALVFFIYQKITRQNKKQLSRAHYTMEIVPDKELAAQNGNAITELLDKTPGIIKGRCEAAGYLAIIRISGTDKRFDITVQHVDDTLRVKEIITRNHKLEFREIYSLNDIPSFVTIGDIIARKYLPQPAPKSSSGKKSEDSAISPEVRSLLRNMGKSKEDEELAKSGLASILSFDNFYSTNAGNGSFIPNTGSINEKDTALLNKIIQSPELLQELPRDIKFYYGPDNGHSKKNGTSIFYLYAIRTGGNEMAELQNRDIESAKQDYDQAGHPEVSFRFSPAGAGKWEQMTRKNIGRSIAIILDNSVMSAPTVNSAIEGGRSVISGGLSFDETRILAGQLNNGAIPAKLNIINQDISPESSGNKWSLLLTILATFVVGSALSWLVFNTLKNK